MTGAFNDKKEILSKWFQVFEDPIQLKKILKKTLMNYCYKWMKKT